MYIYIYLSIRHTYIYILNIQLYIYHNIYDGKIPTFRMPRTMEFLEDRWGDEHVWTKSLDCAARHRIPWIPWADARAKAHFWGRKP